MIATQNRLWTVEEYHRMIEAGILTSKDRVELLEGCVVQMSPQRPPHAATTQRVNRYFQTVLGGKADIRVQLPITLSTSEPEPDIAIVQLDAGEYADHHPYFNQVLLLIEVAYTSLEIDRREKAPIYAKARIEDYWILDIVERQAYIFRNPTSEGYQSETILNADNIITPLAFPELEIPLSELFLSN